MAKQKESFEEQMEKLSGIIELMEKEDVPLETMLAEYEKGMTLVKSLTEKLDAAQASLTALSSGKTEEITIDV